MSKDDTIIIDENLKVVSYKIGTNEDKVECSMVIELTMDKPGEFVLDLLNIKDKDLKLNKAEFSFTLEDEALECYLKVEPQEKCLWYDGKLRFKIEFVKYQEYRKNDYIKDNLFLKKSIEKIKSLTNLNENK